MWRETGSPAGQASGILVQSIEIYILLNIDVECDTILQCQRMALTGNGALAERTTALDPPFDASDPFGSSFQTHLILAMIVDA